MGGVYLSSTPSVGPPNPPDSSLLPCREGILGPGEGPFPRRPGVRTGGTFSRNDTRLRVLEQIPKVVKSIEEVTEATNLVNLEKKK